MSEERIYKKEKSPTSIKFERALLDQVKQDAEKENRSITGQIEYMVKQYYEMKKIIK